MQQLPLLNEVQGGIEQPLDSPRAPHAVLDDVPSQMGRALAQIFAIDSDRADDFSLDQGGPHRAHRAIHTGPKRHHFGSDLCLEGTVKPIVFTADPSMEGRHTTMDLGPR